MKISEVTNLIPLFVATVRVKTSNGTSVVKAPIHADGISQAEQLLSAIFGDSSVYNVCLSEEFGTKVMNSDQLKLKSFADQKALISSNEKKERARQKLVKAQQAVQKANTSMLTTNK